MVDRLVHASFILVVALVNLGTPGLADGWEVYLTKHNGRKKFQAHLGSALMNKEIELESKNMVLNPPLVS